MAACHTAGRILPPALRDRLALLLEKLGPVLTSNDPKHLAQRMALVAFAIRVISAAIAFVSQIILARVMGEFEYGIYVFVWVLVVLFGNLSCLGFHTAIIRFLPQYHARDALPEIRGLTTTVRVFALMSATGLALTGIGGLWLFGDFVDNYYLVPLYLGIFSLPMIALGDVMDGTSRAHSWAVSALSPTYIIRPVLILGFMMLAVAIGEPHTARTAMIAAMAATYLTSVTQFFILTFRLRRRYVKGPRRIEFGTWIRVALPIFLIEGFGFMLTNSDVVIVGLYLDPESVAIYFAAAKTMALVHFVMFSVKAAAAPRFSAAMADPDRQQLAVIAVESAKWSFWPSLVVGAMVLACGNFLLSLFGPAFTSGYTLMAILFAGIMAKALVGPAEAFLTMAGQQKLCVALYATALVANLILNTTLIPMFGLTGAAFATAGAMVVEAILLHVAVRRTFGITLFAFADPHARTIKAEATRS
ncbi:MULTISPECIES: lipopolysaccharide biosynthesis protein [unclassified Rhizobium]|uniref:lipopolysaccharide biosynthesis protein n=1 Tax=unclassified Rhizobium TaxID=2613769 RepID=UPI000712BD3E|nr:MULTISPECIES: lipopolysaccharide biosynthesis protein [unclassified Rhizobium]KQS95131.1 multi antimicrobial extrusion protein MatE [Rhizobium sp. Leaf386]KQS95665.1 multi antimicrobial extrusion protein MatE [Rhizobium sp. Leaf391]KQU01892.1 multi antimicrobial extrusion protein MatE [Rhizobium sp. Leaf453]